MGYISSVATTWPWNLKLVLKIYNMTTKSRFHIINLTAEGNDIDYNNYRIAQIFRGSKFSWFWKYWYKFPYSHVLFFKTMKSTKIFTHKNIALHGMHTLGLAYMAYILMSCLGFPWEIPWEIPNSYTMCLMTTHF